MKLCTLIQSMTASERRHFKSYTKSGTDKQPKYIALFDALCKAKSSIEMEEVAKKKFRNSDRNLLFEKLLEALPIFHSQKSIDAKIQLLISQAVILQEKNVWDEVDRRLQKAKKLALKNERLTLLLRILELQKDMATMKADVPVQKALAKEHLKVGKLLIEEINYENQKILLLLTKKCLDLTTTEKLKELKKLTHPSQLPDLQPSSTTLSRIHYYGAKFIYELFSMNNIKQRDFYAKKILNIYKESDFIFSNKRSVVISEYFNSLIFLTESDVKEIDIDDIINNLAIKSDSMIYMLYGYTISNCTYHHNEEQGKAIIHKMTKENVIDNFPINKKIFFYYKIILFYGAFGHWKEANVWFKRLCTIKRPKVERHLQVKIRLYSLMINYEINEDTDIHIRSVQKYLKRNNLYTDIEKNILEAFSQLDQAHLYSDKIKIWTALYDTLVSIQSLGTHIPVTLELWCTSKIEDITIAKVILRIRQRIAAAG